MSSSDEISVVTGTKPKKRLVNKAMWKRNVVKMKRNSGESYVSDKTKQHVPAKRRRSGCDCEMKNETAKQGWCKYHTLSDLDKDNLFVGFYKLGNYNSQNAFLFGLIKSSKCKRGYKKKRNDENSSRRKVTYTYFLKNGEGEDVRVCLKSFMDTFAISKKRVAVVRSGDRPIDLNNIRAESPGISDEDDQEQNEPLERSVLLPHSDKRGRHGKNIRKLTDPQIEFVVKHIGMFPRYTSHYSRKKNPHKSYIRSVSSVSEMYRAYLTEHAKQSDIGLPVKYEKYLDIFNTRFNIGFKPPLSDTCSVCDEWKFKDEDIVPYAYRLHKMKAELGYKLLSETKRLSKDPSFEYCVITYDLQQAMPLPKIPTETVFYLRQLWVYNLGFHVCNNNMAFMCMWPENVASRGSCEIGSCVFKILSDSTLVLGKKKLWFFRTRVVVKTRT